MVPIVVKSLAYRWLRLCVLWMILFLATCLYIVHFKTNTSRAYNLGIENRVLRVPLKYIKNGDDKHKQEHSVIDSLSVNGIYIAGGDSHDGEDASEPFVLKIKERNEDTLTDNNNDNDRTNDDNDDQNGDESSLPTDINKATFAKVYAKNYISKNLGGIPPNVVVTYLPADPNKPSTTPDYSSYEKEVMNAHVPSYENILEELVYDAIKDNQNSGNKPIHFTLPNMYKKWNVPWTIRDSGLFPKAIYSPPAGEIPKQRFPQAILFGVGKCGTRALIEFLGMNPFVVHAKNEIHYFDVYDDKGLDWYRQQMPLSYSNQVTMEKSPSYIWFESAVNGIYKMNPNVKLVVIMKDPVDRVISQAVRNKRGDYMLTFATKDENGIYQIRQTSKTLLWGAYVKYMRKWIDTFGEKQIHVVEAQELAADPPKEIMKIEKFLGVASRLSEDNFYFNKTKGFHCMKPLHMKNQVVCLSDGKGMKHPDLPREMEDLLYDYYAPHNEALYKLLGRRFNWVPSYMRNKTKS